VALTAAVLLLLRHSPVAWCSAAGLVLLVSALRVIRPRRADEEPVWQPTAPEDRSCSDETKPLQILHLAFDDHRFPGSGGGAVRTFEVNRRLAQRHQVTVVTLNYKGARERVEEGIRYVQVGIPYSYFGRIISYLLCLPLALRRYPSDLVVEDFTPVQAAVLPRRTVGRKDAPATHRGVLRNRRAAAGPQPGSRRQGHPERRGTSGCLGQRAE
jgi:hypothetical protein